MSGGVTKGEETPWVLTPGVRLAYTEGLIGLHFRINGESGSYRNDNVLGHRDMTYINDLIENDELRRKGMR